ncbi:hypothetical protein JW824_13600 [bacterium]|nr:hypothetical protein [bacterium]
MGEWIQSLDKMVENAIHLKQIRKSGLQFGDLIVITTRNSVYSICVLDDNLYQVSGGWFDRKGLSPMKLPITGCTWGGSVIKMDIVAACGLCLEFGNRVVTSPIRKMCVIPCSSLS